MSEKYNINKFECEYEPFGVHETLLCLAHVAPLGKMVLSPSRYGPEMGEHRPCMGVEAMGVWLFYVPKIATFYDGEEDIILPMQLTFTLEGIPLEIENTFKLAWIANGMNVMAAIKEWEEK